MKTEDEIQQEAYINVVDYVSVYYGHIRDNRFGAAEKLTTAWLLRVAQYAIDARDQATFYACAKEMYRRARLDRRRYRSGK